MLKAECFEQVQDPWYKNEISFYYFDNFVNACNFVIKISVTEDNSCILYTTLDTGIQRGTF